MVQPPEPNADIQRRRRVTAIGNQQNGSRAVQLGKTPERQRAAGDEPGRDGQRRSKLMQPEKRCRPEGAQRQQPTPVIHRQNLPRRRHWLPPDQPGSQRQCDMGAGQDGEQPGRQGIPRQERRLNKQRDPATRIGKGDASRSDRRQQAQTDEPQQSGELGFRGCPVVEPVAIIEDTFSRDWTRAM